MVEEKKTFEEWDKELGFTIDLKKTKLTKEQYATLKKRQLRKQQFQNILSVLGTIGKRIGRNYNDIKGFGAVSTLQQIAEKG